MTESNSESAVISGYKPCYVELEKGKTYLWCACGRSKNQPFCDSSHRGTSFRPIKYVAKEDGEEVLFCACKRSAEKPFCDGTHNSLKDKYDEDDPQSRENLAIPQVEAGGNGKARLDGGCYVCSIPALTLERNGTLGFAPTIASSDGAKYQSQFYLEAAGGESPVISFGDRHVVLLVNGREGDGSDLWSVRSKSRRLTGSTFEEARHFPSKTLDRARCISSPPSVLRRNNRRFRRGNARTISIAPIRSGWSASTASERRSMADRFFQLLVDKKIGSDVVTQFIGEIPVSKAMPHRHLYEETLVILEGEGCMWTESKKAPVRAGDIIFLPRKQLHSLQCTDDNGMLVVGVIYPGDNPSINY